MFIKKTYYTNRILYIFLFINSLIYTIIVSLIFFHSLVLIKLLIIKSIVLFLHKHQIFHNLMFSIISAYLTYKNWFMPVSDENINPNPNKDKEEEMSTAAYVICGVFGAIITVTVGIRVLQEFFPEAIPAMQNMLVSVGTTLMATFQSTVDKSKLEFSVGASEPAANAEASEATAAANAEASEAAAAANAEASEAAAAANAEASEASAAANAEASEASAAANFNASDETTVSKTEKLDVSKVAKRSKKLKRKLFKSVKKTKAAMGESSEETAIPKTEKSGAEKLAKKAKKSSKFFNTMKMSEEEKERQATEVARIILKTTNAMGNKVENPVDIFRAGVYAAKVQKIAIDSDIAPEAYLRALQLLFHHNVPVSDCNEPKDLFDVLNKIMSLPEDSILYPKDSLKEIDRYFYRIAYKTWHELNK